MSTVETQTEERRGARLAGAALATFGLALAAAGPLMIILVDLASTPFVLPFVLLPAVGAVLAWYFGTWSKVVALVLGGLLILSTVGGPAGEGLAYPESFFDFVPGVMFLVGGLVTIAGAAVALASRNSDRPAFRAREGQMARVTLALVAVAAVGSGAASALTNATLTEDERAGATEVVLVDTEFEPEQLSLPTGESTLVLRNDGRFLHTFTSDALGVDRTVVPGDEVLVTVTAAEAGSFQYWCVPHSGETDEGDRDGMAGELTVG